MEALMGPTTAVLLFLLLIPTYVHAQSTTDPVSRADVTVSTGWFTADRPVQADCCSSWSAGLFKGVSAGYYWTDHLKSEGAFSAPGQTNAYGSSSERLANGSFRYTSERHSYDGPKFSIAQIYQFGHNSTFHPFVVAGVDVDRERDSIDRYVSTTSIQIEDERTETSIRTRAFAGAGFKAYFTERAFFRGEARFAGGPSPNQMTWTAGVGVDLGGARRQTGPAGRPAAVSEVEPQRLNLRGGTSESRSHAVARAHEAPEVWRAYVSRLATGAEVDVTAAGGERFVALFVDADNDGITVKPVTRVAEPIRHVAFDRLETLALHDGPRPGARVGATLAGVGAGAGTFIIVLTMLLSHFGG
jgi:hypothetical protein